MKKKIVVFYTNKADKETLEEILGKVVMKGVEIFFVDHEKSALELIKTEHPHLILLADGCSFFAEQNIPLIALKKPYQKEEIVRECDVLLNLVDLEISEELPM